MSTARHKIIHLVRHGQALHNVRAEPARKAGCSFDDFLQLMREDDAVDAALTQEGIAQATRVQQQTASAELQINPQLVVVSPLSRAIDTGIIVFGTQDLPYICIESLRERSGMLLNGQRREVEYLRKKYPAINFDDISPGSDAGWEKYGAEMLETKEACARRAYESLLWIVKTRKETEVAIVAHGGLFHEMTNGIPELIKCDQNTAERFHNCELRTLKLHWNEDPATAENLVLHLEKFTAP